jgi:hypothetical protein
MTQGQDLRSRRSSLRQSGTLSSFVFRFCALRAQKRNTDKIASTMLPQAKSGLRAALRKSCQGGVYMPSDTLSTKIHRGMRVISADGVSVGNVWRVHFRDTETYINDYRFNSR